MKENEKYLVPALIRGLKILELFTPEKNELTLSEISLAIDINRSSAFRLLQTLEYSGYLSRTDKKTYILNIKTLQLGYSTLANFSINEKAVPYMKELRDQTKMAVHLSILDNTDIVYINNIQAIGAFTSNIRIGTRWPAHATVIGQFLLSNLSNEEIINRYEKFNEWSQYSQSTPMNLDQLLEKVEKSRKSEFLISWGQFKNTMTASAVPIKSKKDGSINYVLSVSYPSTYINKENYEKEIIPLLLKTAEDISFYIT